MSIVVFDARAVAACESEDVFEAGYKLGLDLHQGDTVLMPCLGSSLLSLLTVARRDSQAFSL